MTTGAVQLPAQPVAFRSGLPSDPLASPSGKNSFEDAMKRQEGARTASGKDAEDKKGIETRTPRLARLLDRLSGLDANAPANANASKEPQPENEKDESCPDGEPAEKKADDQDGAPILLSLAERMTLFQFRKPVTEQPAARTAPVAKGNAEALAKDTANGTIDLAKGLIDAAATKPGVIALGSPAPEIIEHTVAERDESRTGAEKSTAKAIVLADQGIPAPAQQTMTRLLDALAPAVTVAAAPEKAAIHHAQSQIGTTSAHILQVQLHPAELGMVTASLRFAGGQLSIELQTDNSEAYKRLSSDSDAIVNSMRGLGYDIDKVTVLQPQIAVNGATRADQTGSAIAQDFAGGDRSGSGAAGTGGHRQNGQQTGNGNANDGYRRENFLAGAGDRGGGAVYI